MTLSGTNTYTDVTTINDGTLNFSGSGAIANSSQYLLGTVAPVLQVDTNGRLGSGLINITSSGTAAGPSAGSSGRLELSGNTSLPNNITLAPRNDTNASDAIRSVSGNNTLSGPVTITTGGNQSRIQSHAGLLILSGGISTTAMTVRDLYLQGAGNGLVSGAISDGSASINLHKEGAGTWILSGSNTYTGTTTVSAGKLLVDGSTSTGAVTVAATGTLGGIGTIGGNVLMQVDGSTIITQFSGGTIDPLDILGNLDLSAANNLLTVTGTGTGTSWAIINYSGTLTGTFETITPGYSVNYGTGSNSVITLNFTGLPGDWNHDGKVDAGDYVTWRKNPAANGDPGGYTIWRQNFGTPPGSGSSLGGAGSAVPEPGTCLLLCLGGIAMLAAGRFDAVQRRSRA